MLKATATFEDQLSAFETVAYAKVECDFALVNVQRKVRIASLTVVCKECVLRDDSIGASKPALSSTTP